MKNPDFQLDETLGNRGFFIVIRRDWPRDLAGEQRAGTGKDIFNSEAIGFEQFFQLARKHRSHLWR